MPSPPAPPARPRRSARRSSSKALSSASRQRAGVGRQHARSASAAMPWRISASASNATWSATPRTPHASSSTTARPARERGGASRSSNSVRSRCTQRGRVEVAPRRQLDQLVGHLGQRVHHRRTAASAGRPGLVGQRHQSPGSAPPAPAAPPAARRTCPRTRRRTPASRPRPPAGRQQLGGAAVTAGTVAQCPAPPSRAR